MNKIILLFFTILVIFLNEANSKCSSNGRGCEYSEDCCSMNCCNAGGCGGHQPFTCIGD
uniref:Uncharacterized protein n=1 Tax=Meloidogyne enterolobii TaxID=390850 RepID=A0A6V7XSN4_MELEN|nr:unnamed protein product [Meloidogyne enterolobii]CAD2202293.1 unnamed protein product [Meloidogyne enterolobii]